RQLHIGFRHVTLILPSLWCGSARGSLALRIHLLDVIVDVLLGDLLVLDERGQALLGELGRLAPHASAQLIAADFEIVTMLVIVVAAGVLDRLVDLGKRRSRRKHGSE